MNKFLEKYILEDFQLPFISVESEVSDWALIEKAIPMKVYAVTSTSGAPYDPKGRCSALITSTKRINIILMRDAIGSYGEDEITADMDKIYKEILNTPGEELILLRTEKPYLKHIIDARLRGTFRDSYE